jgi:hypothetical protein
MNQNKPRLEQAKLARAYMRGGTPPYQAARKCGFVRVALMEEAIHELETQEKFESSPAVENVAAQGSDSSAHLQKAQITFDTKPPVGTKPEPKQFYKPLQNWRNEKASVSYYGQNDNLSPMYRLLLDGQPIYLNIPESSIKEVASLLCEVAGLNGPGSKETSNSGRIAELEAELEATKAELTYLKLKMFDKLMAMV